MRSSCVSHPTHEPLVLIRAWQVEACDGNHCAAALLAFFEHGHNLKLETRAQAAHANEVAEAHDEAGTHATTLLQWYSEEQLAEGILHLYGSKSIRCALDLLHTLGFVTIESNPTPRFRFDKTRYFLFHPSRVQSWLDTYAPAKVPDRSGKSAASSGKSAASSGKSAASSGKSAVSLVLFSELTPELPPESESPPRAREAATPAMLPDSESRPSSPPQPPLPPIDPQRGYPMPPDFEVPPALLAQLERDCPAVDIPLAIKRCMATTFRQPILDPALRLHKFCLDEQERAQRPGPGRQRAREPTEAARHHALEDYEATIARLLGGTSTPQEGGDDVHP